MTSQERDAGEPGGAIDVAQVAANVPLVLRTASGVAFLGIAINILGVVTVALLITAMSARVAADQFTVLSTTAIIITAFSVFSGVALAVAIQRRTLRWLLRGDPPDYRDARRALRVPLDLALITGAHWALGALVMPIVGFASGLSSKNALGLGGGLLVAGFVSAGFTYLVMRRFGQPVARLALAASPPRSAPMFGVRWHLLTNWVLTSGLPLVGVVLVLTAPPGQDNKIAVSLVVVGISLWLGAISTALVARAIGTPLRGVVDAMRTVGEGNLDVDLEVDDAGEIGLVENGFNEMVAGLRERDRVTDLFGRHVGGAVAAEAINTGVTLSGESRDVVALFVDITGSTKLTRVTEPAELVAMLNRFFEVVVDEVESNGGLLNKFEGDAALCVFGAPTEIPDAATRGLRVARAIRDRVAELGELEIGVGVASGPVIAGQIGAARRLEYTVIGDAVNEAARLTEQAKRVDGRVLASATAVDAAADDEREEWIKGRSFRLRGREAPTHSYRTVSVPNPSPSLQRRFGDVARAVAELPPRPSWTRAAPDDGGDGGDGSVGTLDDGVAEVDETEAEFAQQPADERQ